MDRLTSMTVFAEVAASSSFSVAARQLGISQATASKHVQMLESWLGARLLNRTTRRVALTRTGESFFVQCNRILEDMETARQAGKPDPVVRGTLRMTAPVGLSGTRFGTLMVEFMRRNPSLSVNVTLVDRPVDVIEEGYDVALQVAHRHKPVNRDRAGVVVHPIMPIPYAVCAAPRYLALAGVPESPAALSQHECLTDSRHPGDIWHFTGPDGDTEAVIGGRFKSDNGMLRRDATLAGGGIAKLPLRFVRDDIEAGRLIRLLPHYAPKDDVLQAVYAEALENQPKLRAFIAFITAELSNADEIVRSKPHLAEVVGTEAVI